MAVNPDWQGSCDNGNSDDEQYVVACVLEHVLRSVCQLFENYESDVHEDVKENEDFSELHCETSEVSSCSSITYCQQSIIGQSFDQTAVAHKSADCDVDSESPEENTMVQSLDDCVLTIQNLLNSLETNSVSSSTESLFRNSVVGEDIPHLLDNDLCSSSSDGLDLIQGTHSIKCEVSCKDCDPSYCETSRTNCREVKSAIVYSHGEAEALTHSAAVVPDDTKRTVSETEQRETDCNSGKCCTIVDNTARLNADEPTNSQKMPPAHTASGTSESVAACVNGSEDKDSTLFEKTIPVGWLNTISHRRTRNYATLTKTAMRKQDFSYCGPSRPMDPLDINDNVMESDDSCVRLGTPSKADEICLEILYSSIGIAPGTFDMHGRSLVAVDCSEIVWEKCDTGSIGLAHYFLYLTSRLAEVTMLIDERNSNDVSLASVLEALRIYNANTHISVLQVVLLSNCGKNIADKLKEIFHVECRVVNTCNALLEFITSTNLPTHLGGDFRFSQAEWVQNRLTVDSFVHFCKNVRHNFERQTLLMTSQSLPATVKETRSFLTQHQTDMRHMLDDKQLNHLHDRVQRIMEELLMEDSGDRRCCAELIQSSYHAANDAITHFVHVADERWLALERHLMIKQFEHSCDCIFVWTDRNSALLREKFTEIEDSFELLMAQIREFDEFYMQAMEQYAKSDCLLSNAKQLTNLGYISEEALMRRAELAGEEITKVVAEMESKKQEMEAAGQMYKFVDQAYSWALDGMKFVTTLSRENCLTTESCNKMLANFDQYMDEHPSIPTCRFNEMLELARRYGNAKCMKQLEFAQQKCVETADLFTKRRDLLVKAKHQIRSGGKKKSLSFRMRNREKLDQKNWTRQNGQEVDGQRRASDQSSPLSHLEIRRISVQSSADERMSNDDFSSSVSYDSVSLDADDTQSTGSHDNYSSSTSCSISSGLQAPGSQDDIDCSDAAPELSSARSHKPVRKMLKKSTSVPSTQIQKASLTRHHTQNSLTIGSPVQSDEPIIGGKSKIALTVEELLSTEKEYVRSLNYVIENYFPEMSRLDIPQALRCKRNVIFGNIEKIADFHNHFFLRDLEGCQGDPLLVAKTFQKHKESFGLYALYSKNKPLSDQLLLEHGNEFFKAKQLELGDKMDLASYLLKPVQRMGKYALLLHAMAKRVTGAQERCLKDAEDLVKFQLRHGNDLLTMDSIRDCDVNLKEQGKLLRQEQFVVISGRRKLVRRVFLFEDLILFSKPVPMNGGHDTYQYKCSYKTAEIGMTENIGDSGFKFEIWFRRRKAQTSQATFVLQSAARSIKRAWVEEIRGLLWNQALRNRDHRMVEMSSMGVGSKPHIDLADSGENTIRNRAVGATAPPPAATEEMNERLSKTRTRSSIAVSSFDHVSLNSKRPHSIISTSSSTSSVGSNGSQLPGSVLSSLALASWPGKDATSGRSHSLISSPPAAYCDFKAILEDENEDSESASEGRCSASPDDSQNDEATNDVARQYVTTQSPQPVLIN